MSETRICIFGEVLFDHFADGNRVLGGAPFNVAWHLQAFGQAPCFLSRVGDDSEGEAIRAAMRAWGMDTSGLQTDRTRATGRVDVSVMNGEPSYEIVHPCAYDAIDATATKAECDLLYHGSLCLRDETSMRTLQTLRQNRSDVFVDVNLRPPWWNRQQVLDLVHAAAWVKLNTKELKQLTEADSEVSARATGFVSQHRLQGLLLTHGEEGAEFFGGKGEHFAVRPTPGARVVDTVGAGDAFTSVMILGLVSKWPLPLALQRAQDFASAIVGRRGATVSEPAFYRQFTDQWRSGI